MAANAGSIYYDIEMDTQKLISSQQRVNQRLSSMERGFDSATKSIETTERSMSSLSRIAVALAGALSVLKVAEYADAWATVNNKLSNSLRPSEQLADVTERVFNITQQTRGSLDATASLYSRLERATRQYGTSADDLAKLTTIINQGFVVSGATAQEASNAIIQLSQGLASGALRGEEFNSVNEQGNRLIVALADSMGVSVGQMRQMAAQGKLTTDVIIKGLLSQGTVIGNEFANTTTTINQALQVAGNNITKFFGENASVKAGVSIFNDAVVSLSNNIDVLGAALAAVSAVMGSRYVGALTMATQEKLSGVAAAIKQQAAEYNAAKATMASASAEIKNAQAIIASEQAKARQLATQSAINKQYGLAVNYQAEYAAIQRNIAAAENVATTARQRLAVATQQASVANRVYAASATLARGALSLIGGPAGAAMLAAGAIFYFWQKAQQAKQENIDFADSLDGVIAKMKEMNQTQLQGTLGDTAKSIIAQKEKIDDLKSSVSDAQHEYNKYIGLARKLGVEQDQTNGYVQKANEWFYTLSQRKRDLNDATDKLNKTQQQQSQIQEQLNATARESDAAFNVLADNLRVKIPGASQAAITAMASTIQVIDDLNKKAKDAAKEGSEPELSPKAKDLIKNSERRLALAKLEGEARARLQAQYDAEDAGITDSRRLKSLQDEYAATELSISARKSANAEGKKTASQTESISQKLENLRQQSELTADSTANMSREQAILNAQQSLGKGATKEQIKLAGEYRAKAWDTANAIKAQAAAEKLLPETRENASYQQDIDALNTALAAKKITQQQYNQTSEQLEQQHQANLAKIRAQQVVSPQQEALGQIDPVQQLANQHAQQLALIQQFEQQGVLAHDNAIALKNAADNEYDRQRTAAQWELLSQQSLGYDMLTSAVDAFSGNASNALTGLITGSMSAADAMRSLGNTILNSVINSLVQMGVEYVKNMILQQTLGTAAVAATSAQALAAGSAWATPAALASIATLGGAAVAGGSALATTVAGAQALALAGARKNGGPVNAGSMYRVGEGGMPEIYRASNGSQYMIPGDNGRVISNKELSGGGNIQVSVNFNDYSSGGHSFDAQATQNGNSITVEAFITDMDNKGPMHSSIIRNTTATPRTR